MPRKFEALTVRELDERAEAFEALVVSGMRRVVRESIKRADAERVIVAARDDDTDPFSFLAFIRQLWNAFVGEKLTPFLRRTMRDTGADQFAGFMSDLFAGVSESNPQRAMVAQRVDQPLETERYLRQAPNRLARIGDDLWDDARDELVEGIDKGESIDDLAKRVMKAVDVAEPRARTIARTEANGAMNSVVNDTNHYVDDLFPEVDDGIRKEWSATHDLRTRATHVAADGQVVGLDDPFIVGNASLQFPGDPSGPPGEIINCRCTTLTVLSDELIRAAGGEPSEEEDDLTDDTITAAGGAFHLPGKHDQKRHGNRYKGGVQVKGIDKAGNPVKLPGPDAGASPTKSTKAKATKPAPKKTPTTAKPKPAKSTQPKQEEPTPQPKPTTVAKPDDDYRKVSYSKVVSEYEEKLGEVKPYQADALAYYTGNGYRTMQRGLREAKGDPTKMPMGVGAYTRHINQLMDQAGPSTDRYELYRGVGDISIALGTSKPEPGMRFGDYGFGSTSMDIGAAKTFAYNEKKSSGSTDHVVMYIDAPAGTRMIPVRAVKTKNGLKVGYAEEDEMLLPNGVEYEVTKFVETAGSAPNKLYVRITGNDYVMTAAATSFEEDYDRRLDENGDETKGSPVFYVISSPPSDDEDLEDEGEDDDDVVIASNTENGVTMADDTDVEEDTVVDDARYASWSGVIALEGVPTGDGRQFEHNSLSWGDLPQPLGWMYERSHGGMPTDKVVNVGLIDTIERGEGGLIVATGRIDLHSERGWELASMMGTREDPGSVAGISIDADDPDDPMGMDIEYRYAEGCDVTGEEAYDEDAGMKCMMPSLMVFHSGRIRAATLVDIPAFMEARIYLDQPLDYDGDEGELHDVVSVEESEYALTASAYTMTLTDLPPASWFTEPTDEPDIGAITVTDEGRIFGYLAPANVAHRGHRDKRVTVPMGNVDYGIWMNRVTIVDDGEGGFRRLATGPITMNCGHASSSSRVIGQARTQHYDNSCSVVATACVGENRKGVWIAGAVLPDVTADQVRRMMTLQLSGDWGPHREKPGKRELAGALLVPVPGFPRRSFSTMNLRNGTLQSATVPLRFAVTEPHDDERIFGARAAADRIAASVGRDRLSRARELAAKVRGL